MDAIELFEAGIRMFGLYCIGRGSLDMLNAAVWEFGILDRSVNSSRPVWSWLVGTICFTIGLYLLNGAPMVVQYAFRGQNRQDNSVPPPPIFDQEAKDQ